MTWSWLSPGLLWFLVGALLLILEMMTPGVLAVFFAAGAWVVAILFWLGWVESFAVGMGIFLAVSIVLLLVLRRRFVPVVKQTMDSSGNTDDELDDFQNQVAKVVEPIDGSGKKGKVEFRGSLWEADSEMPIESGTMVRILSRANLTLNVKPVKE